MERRATTNGSISKPSTRHAMAPCWSWNIFMRIFTPGSKVALTNSPSPAESALNGRRRGQLQEGALNP